MVLYYDKILRFKGYRKYFIIAIFYTENEFLNFSEPQLVFPWGFNGAPK